MLLVREVFKISEISNPLTEDQDWALEDQMALGWDAIDSQPYVDELGVDGSENRGPGSRCGPPSTMT